MKNLTYIFLIRHDEIINLNSPGVLKLVFDNNKLIELVQIV